MLQILTELKLSQKESIMQEDLIFLWIIHYLCYWSYYKDIIHYAKTVFLCRCHCFIFGQFGSVI